MSKQVIERLKKQFGDAIVETHSQFGDDTAVVRAESWHDAALFLRDDSRCAMNMFVDLTAVDYLNRRSGDRFDVVLHLRSLERMHRVRLKARIGSAAESHPEIASVTDVWMGANWFEREAWDMFGIKFVGHPDLRRILMYEEFEGHALRKDYDVQHAQPLIPYREEALDKLPPFGPSEGLPFGRQVHANRSIANAVVPSALVHSEDGAEAGPPGLNPLGFVEDN